MSEWQPIETAPRDGTQILLIRANAPKTICSGHYQESRYQRTWGGCIIKDPTHWRPLLEPPK
jgi:hypothetical protein